MVFVNSPYNNPEYRSSDMICDSHICGHLRDLVGLSPIKNFECASILVRSNKSSRSVAADIRTEKLKITVFLTPYSVELSTMMIEQR